MSRDRIQKIKTKPIFAYLASHFHPEVVKKKNQHNQEERGYPWKGEKGEMG